MNPNFKIESLCKKPVIGLDEVGRGPLAGPVVSCACIFFNHSMENSDIRKINDSKKLTPIKRKNAHDIIMQLKKNKILDYRIGTASVEEIDKYNILNATIISMKRAIYKLGQSFGTIIVDGNINLKISNLLCKNFIKGDQISITIAAASIIAKVHRDNYMRKIGINYPYYKWDSNAGYGTAEHKNQIKNHGISKHHRKSFLPIKKFIQNNNISC